MNICFMYTIYIVTPLVQSIFMGRYLVEIKNWLEDLTCIYTQYCTESPSNSSTSQDDQNHQNFKNTKNILFVGNEKMTRFRSNNNAWEITTFWKLKRNNRSTAISHHYKILVLIGLLFLRTLLHLRQWRNFNTEIISPAEWLIEVTEI